MRYLLDTVDNHPEEECPFTTRTCNASRSNKIIIASHVNYDQIYSTKTNLDNISKLVNGK